MSSQSSQTLPTSRSYLSALFASFPQGQKLPYPQPEGTPNPLLSAPPAIKSLLLTLHVLFPNELLPALDLLDRRLVTRLILNPSARDGVSLAGVEGNGESEEGLPTGDSKEYVKEKGRTVYYVRSSQQPRSRFSSGSSRTYDALAGIGQSYEVRLRPWNCSCPALAFASVACIGEGLLSRITIHEGNGVEARIEGLERTDWGPDRGARRFGGLIRGEGEVPVCKHLLACYLAESWKGFEGCVDERIVSREEMSGWAAGWGG
ncbi:MAG: hypothetical protein Q9186_004574 [Xanthomendoza sp. 1 TL-2023]